MTKAITEVFAEVNRKDAGDSAKDFELLEGLDPALAKEMIGALAKPQNHPIGTTPPQLSQPQQHSDASASVDNDPANTEGTPFWVFGGIGGVIVVMFLVIGGANRSRY